MECKTIKSFKENGKPNFVLKVKHDNIFSAQKEADRFNNLPKNVIKRVAYQCSVCGSYHVGTSTEMLENKKAKGGWIGRFMKVVGEIDLAQFVKPPKEKPIKQEVLKVETIK